MRTLKIKSHQHLVSPVLPVGGIKRKEDKMKKEELRKQFKNETGITEFECNCSEYADWLEGKIINDLSEVGAKSAVQHLVSQPGRVGSKGGTLNAGESIAELKLKLKAADLVMKAIDEMVDRGALDSRSQIADARLNYCVPFQYHYLKG